MAKVGAFEDMITAVTTLDSHNTLRTSLATTILFSFLTRLRHAQPSSMDSLSQALPVESKVSNGGTSRGESTKPRAPSKGNSARPRPRDTIHKETEAFLEIVHRALVSSCWPNICVVYDRHFPLPVSSAHVYCDQRFGVAQCNSLRLPVAAVLYSRYISLGQDVRLAYGRRLLLLLIRSCLPCAFCMTSGYRASSSTVDCRVGFCLIQAFVSSISFKTFPGVLYIHPEFSLPCPALMLRL